MKRLLFIIASILFLGFGLSSCTSNDVEVKKNVEYTLGSEYKNISVSVINHVVTLRGTLPNSEEKNKVGDIVKNIKYVRSVNNKIFVGSIDALKNAYSDEDLANQASNALQTKGFKDINVEAKDGIITLSGNVRKADLETVLQAVDDIHPFSVKNDMKVTP